MWHSSLRRLTRVTNHFLCGMILQVTLSLSQKLWCSPGKLTKKSIATGGIWKPCFHASSYQWDIPRDIFQTYPAVVSWTKFNVHARHPGRFHDKCESKPKLTRAIQPMKIWIQLSKPTGPSSIWSFSNLYFWALKVVDHVPHVSARVSSLFAAAESWKPHAHRAQQLEWIYRHCFAVHAPHCAQGRNCSSRFYLKSPQVCM